MQAGVQGMGAKGKDVVAQEGGEEKEGLLFRAHGLASDITSSMRGATLRRQRQRDALELLERLAQDVQEGLSSDDAERLEARLQVSLPGRSSLGVLLARQRAGGGRRRAD